MIGKIFGNVKVIKRDENSIGKQNYKSNWICECNCEKHNIITLSYKTLINNKNVSCGCKNKTRLIDLTGQRYGKLTVLQRDTRKKSKDTYWICKCDCGNITTINGAHLKNGNTISCGCFKKSKGELKISEILKVLKYNYREQYRFEDEELKFNKLKFDFAIFQNNKIICFIEYQGSQHYYPFEHFGGEENLKIRQERDFRKKELAKKYNIPLIEISYTDYNNINEKYLQNLINDTINQTT